MPNINKLSCNPEWMRILYLKHMPGQEQIAPIVPPGIRIVIERDDGLGISDIDAITMLTLAIEDIDLKIRKTT